MNYIRKVTNSDVLAKVIDIPKELRNRTVEIIIIPYEGSETPYKKSVKGALAKYRNEELISKESEAWAIALEEQYENS